jgi:hypothetical protein
VSRPGRAGAALVAALLCIAALPGLAAPTEVRDPNDARGWLDVRRVFKWGRPEHPGWRIVTGRRWRAKWLWDKGFLVLTLDTFGDPLPDYYVVIGSDGRGLDASLWRKRRGARDRRLRRVKAWRPDRRSVIVRLPLRHVFVGPRREHFGWFVQTLLTSRRCPRVCFDRVPDRGMITQPLPPHHL